MATLLSEIITNARVDLQELVPKLWTDAELLVHVNACIKDLWRSLNTQYQNFYFETTPDVTYVSGSDRLSNVPAWCSTILGLELAEPSLYPGIIFVYRDFNSDEFISARAAEDQSPTNIGRVLFCATGAGAPTAAPTIYIAPRLSANMALRLTAIPVLGKLPETAGNPVPGESDHAIRCWIVAHARSKIRDDSTPDSEWLALYATEKTNILVAVAPRQEVTDQIAESVFGEY